MAIAIVQSASGSSGAATATSVTTTLATTPISGNLLVAVLSQNNGATITPPSGWSQAVPVDVGGPLTAGAPLVQIGSHGLWAYSKIAGAAEPTADTWSSSSADYFGAAVYEISGADTANPCSWAPTPAAPVPASLTTLLAALDLPTATMALVAGCIDNAGSFSATSAGFTGDYTVPTNKPMVAGHIAPPTAPLAPALSLTWSGGQNSSSGGLLLVIHPPAEAAFTGAEHTDSGASGAPSDTGFVYKGRDTASADSGSVA